MDGGDGPLGARWPGFERAPVRRNLDDDDVRRALFLDAAALSRFAAGGAIVTDDNQLLQFSQLRAGLGRGRAVRLQRENLARLIRAAGRKPYWRGWRGRG